MFWSKKKQPSKSNSDYSPGKSKSQPGQSENGKDKSEKSQATPVFPTDSEFVFYEDK
ncbi:MAG: hypothetical protein L0Y74_01600 [candidate division Zixibacteria bacterium]|nr:hypothetical protein [candidate division Zixibacteria bacterium]